MCKPTGVHLCAFYVVLNIIYEPSTANRHRKPHSCLAEKYSVSSLTINRHSNTAPQSGKKNLVATMAVDDKAVPLRSDSPVHLVMVNVIAPATLPAGYEFEAQVQNDPEMTVHAVVVGSPRVGRRPSCKDVSSHPVSFHIACRWCEGRRCL